jgi:hypothetical protein
MCAPSFPSAVTQATVDPLTGELQPHDLVTDSHQEDHLSNRSHLWPYMSTLDRVDTLGLMQKPRPIATERKQCHSRLNRSAI